MSGVPQGSVLFLVYINDLTNNLVSSVCLFADDAKIDSLIKTEEDVDALCRDMARLDEWSDQWLLTFNTVKCNAMHIGHRNQQASYPLRGTVLHTITQEKDLGILISNDLKSSAHVACVAAKANSHLGIIKRNFTILNKAIMVPLYLSLVRPILDYGAQVWSPHLVRDIQTLE